MADGTASIVPATPDEVVTPSGVNHLVINVRDIEESHKFWTETLGFKQVAYSKRRNGKMRFYSGDHDGRMNHHDIALCENPNLPKPPAEWSMFDQPVAINHIAISMPSRERAEAIGLATREGRQVRTPRQPRHDAQPLHRRSQRLRRRGALRIASRGVGRQHPGRDRLRRAGADRRRRGLHRRHELPDVQHRRKSHRIARSAEVGLARVSFEAAAVATTHTTLEIVYPRLIGV